MFKLHQLNLSEGSVIPDNIQYKLLILVTAHLQIYSSLSFEGQGFEGHFLLPNLLFPVTDQLKIISPHLTLS